MIIFRTTTFGRSLWTRDQPDSENATNNSHQLKVKHIHVTGGILSQNLIRKWPQTHALERGVTGTGNVVYYRTQITVASNYDPSYIQIPSVQTCSDILQTPYCDTI